MIEAYEIKKKPIIALYVIVGFCRLIIIVFLIFISTFRGYTQDNSFYILEVNKKWYANVIQDRFHKAVVLNRYFICDYKEKSRETYCFEVDEDDLELRYGLLNRRVIPKRFKKNITYYEIMFIGEDGQYILSK